MNSIEKFAERNGIRLIISRWNNEPELQPNAKSMFGVGAAKLRDSKRI